MNQLDRSDRSSDILVRRSGDTCGDRRPDRESGQATTEFALILLPLLLIVGGIIHFGIALNFWLDEQRIANQGARWAAVANWPPECPVGATTCNNAPACDALTRTNVQLQNTLRCQAIAQGLRDSIAVELCFPAGGTPIVGDPVRVRVTSPFTFIPILQLGTIELRADATMRIEQKPDVYAASAVSC